MMYVCMCCLVSLHCPQGASLAVVNNIVQLFYYYYFSCHPTMRTCAASSSTWITHNFPEIRKPRKQKETHAPSLPPFCANFWLVYYIYLLSLLLPSHAIVERLSMYRRA